MFSGENLVNACTLRREDGDCNAGIQKLTTFSKKPLKSIEFPKDSIFIR